MRRARLLTPALALGLAASLAACGSDAGDAPAGGAEGAGEASGDALVIYSGRSENLVDPVLTRLEEAVGVPVEVRYASSSELAALLLEEGEATERDLFFSQDAGALGALANADMLVMLAP